MARGWESKGIEDQINSREDENPVAGKSRLTAKERELHAKREGLLLARAHTLSALQTAQNKRYREQLERALEHLDSELAALDGN